VNLLNEKIVEEKEDSQLFSLESEHAIKKFKLQMMKASNCNTERLVDS